MGFIAVTTGERTGQPFLGKRWTSARSSRSSPASEPAAAAERT